MILKLDQVTLVCFDTRNIEAAIFSMNISLKKAKFAESILFTNKSMCSKVLRSKAKIAGIKLMDAPKISSISDYSLFILSNLYSYVNTEFCLITQWDSWIIDQKLWDSQFLDYDYIGAIWPHYSVNQVGNGGFSLRSKKLLESTGEYIKNNLDFSTPLIEDDYICRQYRDIFEKKYKINFSSSEVANKFSIERNGHPINSFGFHGMYNFNFEKLTIFFRC